MKKLIIFILLALTSLVSTGVCSADEAADIRLFSHILFEETNAVDVTNHLRETYDWDAEILGRYFGLKPGSFENVSSAVHKLAARLTDITYVTEAPWVPVPNTVGHYIQFVTVGESKALVRINFYRDFSLVMVESAHRNVLRLE